MKAVLFVTFLLLNDPSVYITKAYPFESRVVCEIQEGQLNKDLTSYMDKYYKPEVFNMFGQDMIVGRAVCHDPFQPEL